MFDRQGNRKYLNCVERSTFLLAIKKEPDALRRAFCLTLFYTGCRISEALNITRGQIDFGQKAVIFETLKRRRQGCFRAVPIPDSLVGLLKQLNQTETPSCKIWKFSRATGYRLIKSYMGKAGINMGMNSPKGLRHGFAVACISKKIPLNILKKWMGHARLETTAIYLDVSGDEERNLANRLWNI